jgi:hypothetical protein
VIMLPRMAHRYPRNGSLHDISLSKSSKVTSFTNYIWCFGIICTSIKLGSTYVGRMKRMKLVTSKDGLLSMGIDFLKNCLTMLAVSGL